MGALSWIGLDWGTTNLRAFAVDGDGNIIDERSSSDGMGKLQTDQFEPALINLVSPWFTQSDAPLPIFACGMVGAKQGWFEAKYREVPCQPVSSGGLTVVPTNDNRIKMHILPGLCQRGPSDVMRGEETQIAGFILDRPDFTGSVCLPGTHSKWVSIEDGKIEKFTTFMTGELFDVMSSHSVLKHTVTSDGWDNEAFLQAVQEAVFGPQRVVEFLFGLRANALLEGATNETSRARFSGLLIGQELGLAERYWRERPVALIGSNSTVPHYQSALMDLAVDVDIIDTRKAILSGLSYAAKHAGDQT